MEGTPGDSQYESQFLDDSESQLHPRRELGCGVQADDKDAGLFFHARPAAAPAVSARGRYDAHPCATLSAATGGRLQARRESPRVWSICLCRSARRQQAV
jgi:hypothetical protein